MSTVTILAVVLLAGLPEVVIADEHREGGDPTEIKVTLSNKTEETIVVSFAEQWHTAWFKLSLFGERGQRVVLPERERVRGGGKKELVRIKPGDTVSGYLSPSWDYDMPAGRYQISVRFLHKLRGKDAPREVESNRITKSLPGSGPQASEREFEGRGELVFR